MYICSGPNLIYAQSIKRYHIQKPCGFKTLHWKQRCLHSFLFEFTPFSRTRPCIHRLPGWLVCTHMWFTIAHIMNEHFYNKQPVWLSETRVWRCKVPVSHCKARVWRCKAPSDAECLCKHTARSPRLGMPMKTYGSVQNNTYRATCTEHECTEHAEIYVKSNMCWA